MVTKKDVFAWLERMEIAEDAHVTMHTSLRAVGAIDGGADGLLDAMTAYLHRGLLLIPTHTWAVVTKKNPVFDVRKTVPNIGTLPTVAAFRADAVRTLHPTHSMAIFGKGAREYAEGEEKSQTPAPMGGALSRLYEDKGKIILLGVGQDKNTYFHSVDERINIRNRLNQSPYIATIIDWEGRELKSPLYHSHAGRCSYFYPNYTPALEYAGAVKYDRLGNAKVTLCDAVKSTDILCRMWERADYDLCCDVRPVDEKYYK